MLGLGVVGVTITPRMGLLVLVLVCEQIIVIE
jgi:hypothetical protein